MNSSMTEKRIKTALMLLGEALVIWYGMGTPIPTNIEEGIKLIVALLAITYTGWKNHDFTPEACIGTGITRQLKAEKAAGYDGDYFYLEDEYEEEDEEGEDDDDEQDDMETDGQ